MFENLKTIVVGVDLPKEAASRPVARSLDAAKTLASMFQSRIVVFHAVKQRNGRCARRRAPGVGADDGATAAVVHVSKNPRTRSSST